MKNEFLQWFEENERIPSYNNLNIVDTLSTKDLQSQEDSTLWLYKPFRVKKEYQKVMIKDCVKNEIEQYFLNSLIFDDDKIELEDWVMENMTLASNLLEEELEKRIKAYQELE